MNSMDVRDHLLQAGDSRSKNDEWQIPRQPHSCDTKRTDDDGDDTDNHGVHAITAETEICPELEAVRLSMNPLSVEDATTHGRKLPPMLSAPQTTKAHDHANRMPCHPYLD
jgi:hypothetical protein